MLSARRDNLRQTCAKPDRLDELAADDYDLSLNRYKEVAYEAVEYDSPKVILQRMAKLEEEIEKVRKGLEGMLK